MSCTTIAAPLQRLLDTLTEGPAAGDRLHPQAVDTARRHGWVYEHAGLVALTGAGHHHTSRHRRTGMLE